jgi:hypothetical protein
MHCCEFYRIYNDWSGNAWREQYRRDFRDAFQ